MKIRIDGIEHHTENRWTEKGEVLLWTTGVEDFAPFGLVHNYRQVPCVVIKTEQGTITRINLQQLMYEVVVREVEE